MKKGVDSTHKFSDTDITNTMKVGEEVHVWFDGGCNYIIFTKEDLEKLMEIIK